MVDDDRSYLLLHRKLILSRALVAGGAGLVPLPVLDDLLADLVRTDMLRRIAERRQVDVTHDALTLLTEGPKASRVGNAAVTAATLIALRRAWRKMFLLLSIGRRGDEVVHTFELGTLFDHYCARHHVGAALETEQAQKLHHAIEGARSEVRRTALVKVARSAGRSVGGTLLRLPAGIVGLSRDALSKRGGRHLVRVEPAHGETLRQKATRIFEEEVATAGRGYIDELVAAFDRRWGRS